MIEYLTNHGEIIASIAGIGTFITSLIAIFTLIEVKKQRLSMYKPDVLIKAFLVAISKSPLILEKDELVEYKSLDFNDHSNNYNDAEFSVVPYYKVNNLGLGVAKQIKCQWKFDHVRAIQLIEKKLPKNYTFSHEKALNLYFMSNIENEDFHLSFNANLNPHCIDYIAPINIQQHHHLHSVPKVIVLCHFLYLLFENKLLSKSGENFQYYDFDKIKFPNPVLQIEYLDLNNKKYKKSFKLKASAVTTQLEDILDLTKEFSYLNFEVKK